MCDKNLKPKMTSKDAGSPIQKMSIYGLLDHDNLQRLFGINCLMRYHDNYTFLRSHSKISIGSHDYKW